MTVTSEAKAHPKESIINVSVIKVSLESLFYSLTAHGTAAVAQTVTVEQIAFLHNLYNLINSTPKFCYV